MNSNAQKPISGKTVVMVVIIVGIIGAMIRYTYIPRMNPKQADPGNPYYSRPDDRPVSGSAAARHVER